MAVEKVELPIEAPQALVTRFDEAQKDPPGFARNIVNWARKFSLFQYPFVTACCGMEYMSYMASHYDPARFGAEFPRFSPRQADVMFVVGTISQKLAPVLRKIYDQMAEPKWVIAFGSCASCGGPYDNYATVQGIDRVVPVDVYIAGCPPRPEQVMDAVILLQQKIQGENREGWEARFPVASPPDEDQLVSLRVLERLREKFGEAVLATHSEHGDDTAIIERSKIRDVVAFLRDDPECAMNMLIDLFGLDTQGLGRPVRFEVVYHFYSLGAKKHRVRVKCPVPEDDPTIDSITPLWPGASWYERECWDMFGVRFRGHPDLRRILMYEGFEGHPLRKDYPYNKRQPLIGPPD